MPEWSHFNLFNKDTCDIYMLCIWLCQLFVIRYLIICALLFIIDRSVILYIVRLLFVVFILIDSLFIHCSKEKSNSDPEPCSGITILLPVQVPDCTCSSLSVTIINTSQ
jgi:hypothetical protein